MKPETSEPRKFSPSPRPTTNGGVATGGHDDVGLVRVDCEKGESAFESLASQAHRLGEVAAAVIESGAEDVTDKGGCNFGVGFRLEGDALTQQFLLKLSEVLNDAVVNDCQLAAVGKMRVCVTVGGPAVRSPTGMADAGQGLGNRICFQFRDQVAQLAGLFTGRNGPISDYCDAGGVIAAVFQTAQPFHHNVKSAVSSCLARRIANIAYDSTHGYKPSG